MPCRCSLSTSRLPVPSGKHGKSVCERSPFSSGLFSFASLCALSFFLLSLEVEESSDDLSSFVIVIIISFFWVYVTQVELLRNGNGGARIPATRQGAISAGNARA